MGDLIEEEMNDMNEVYYFFVFMKVVEKRLDSLLWVRERNAIVLKNI